MVAFQLIAALIALGSSLTVLADVTPSEPSPGSVFRAGQTCRLTWQGDTDSTTVWKDMAIELMSGSNLDMVHVTTVTTNQDGTKDGSFEYTCPEVTPYSAIYFYQFSSSHTANKTWTTRFTIESADGSSTPPANAKQPSGEAIPWGVGKLVDASAAVPPPFGGSNSTSSLTSSTRSSPSPSASNSRLTVATSASLSSSSDLASSTSTAKATTATSGALANTVNDWRAWVTASGALVALFL